MDQNELFGVEQVVRNDEAADRIVGHHASGVADDVRIAGLQAKQVLDVESRVHARHHRDALGRLNALFAGVLALVERLAERVQAVVLQNLVGHRMSHGFTSLTLGVSRSEAADAKAAAAI